VRPPPWYGPAVAAVTLVCGVVILVRDLVAVHSVGYGLAGLALVGFGAWRQQGAPPGPR
jgi:hypothetical protein